MPIPRILHEHLLAILDDIGEHGALDTSMVFERHADERTLRAIQMQLQGLEDDGLLFGVQLTVSTATVVKGRKRRVTRRVPTVWTLTPKGGDILESLWGQRPARVQRGEPSPETLLHRMGVVKTRIAFDASCAAAGLAPPAWIHEADTRSTFNSKKPPNQRSRLYHGYKIEGRSIACRLDAACQVLLPPSSDKPSGNMTAVIFGWEIDMSTEGRKQLRATKPLALEMWLREKSFQEYWPDNNQLPTKVRVAWVVPTAKRIEAIAETTENPELLATYRFLTQKDIQSSNLVTDAVWRTSGGDQLPLYRRDITHS